MTELKTRPSALPEARSVLWQPNQEKLRALTALMPNARKTVCGNYNVQTKVTSRSKASTYVVTDSPERHSDQTITVAEGERVAKLQNEYILNQDMLVIDGYIGNDVNERVPARLYIEAANANIAGMQSWLYFEATNPGPSFQPILTVIYTPNLTAPGYPNDRLITVDLAAGITRVFNSDYFGESKKGGLRMWNSLVYDKGGLALHAGCKWIPTPRGDQTMLIVGLSGTGKTTTTFTRQNDSKPVQDDFVALYPEGRVVASENGCFAKTFALSEEFEPTIYHAVTQAESYLENVSQDNHGKVDFFDTNYTQNGRAVFSMKSLGWFKDAQELSSVNQFLILNRNNNLIPAVARLSHAQAAAYFMLGETRGTSAGGAEEAGKFLRVPGTNPFFPLRHEMQGNRFLELMSSSKFEVFLLNTGSIGGEEETPQSKKMTIPISSAVVKALAEGTITWEKDPDFGYEVAKSVPGIEDNELLQPRLLYERLGKLDEYNTIVVQLKKDRKEFLEKWDGLNPEIIAAIQ